MLLLQNERSGVVVLLRLACGGAQLFQRLQPQRDLKALELVAVGKEFLRLFRLLTQRLDLQLQLGDLVADAQKIVLCRCKSPLRLLLAVAVLGDARRLFKNLASVGALDREDLVDTALADIGIALAAEAGVHKQLVDVAQADGLPVDIVFTLAGAVIPAGDDHFVRVVAQGAVGVVQHERGLGKTDLPALLRAAEDDVFHLLSAQRTGVLLAHDPTDRVGDIRFSAAVRADDRGDVVAEADDRPVGERFEALNFEMFQIHGQNAPVVFCNKVLYQILCQIASKKRIFCARGKKIRTVYSQSEFLPGNSSRMASSAAACSARFLLEPLPLPTGVPLSSTRTANSLQWSGPLSATSS